MRKVTTSYQPCNNLEKGEKPNENNSVTTVTTSLPIMGMESKKEAKNMYGGNNREKVVTVVTVVTDPQLWAPGFRAQVGHPKPVKRFLAFNEEGTQRIGEDHPRAKLSDAEVEAIRDEYEAGLDGSGPKIGYRRLAKKWGVTPSTVRNIVTYRKRNQWAGSWKRIT